MNYSSSRSDSTPSIERVGSTEELSLIDFFMQVRIHATAIEETFQRLQYVYTLLSKKDFIWPDQCDYAVARLRKIHQVLNDFIVFLDQIPYLPLQAISKRYPLVAKLVYLDEQIQLLLEKISHLRITCKSRTEHVILQKIEVLKKMEVILQSGEDITCHINTLIESDSTHTFLS